MQVKQIVKRYCGPTITALLVACGLGSIFYVHSNHCAEQRKTAIVKGTVVEKTHYIASSGGYKNYKVVVHVPQLYSIAEVDYAEYSVEEYVVTKEQYDYIHKAQDYRFEILVNVCDKVVSVQHVPRKEAVK